MISKRELENAIDEIERKCNCNYDDCQKLATYYTLYNELYGEPVQPKAVPLEEEIVDVIGDSEFIKSINGKQAKKMWAVMDELLETLKIINDKLYYSVIRRLNE